MPPPIRCPAPRSVGAALGRLQPVQHSLPASQPSRAGSVLSGSSWLDSSRTGSPVARGYATAVSSTLADKLRLPDDYIPPTQPPSARRPEVRKTQLLRTYTSLLKSTPVTLIFQHNNLTAKEWAAVRRELRAALARVPHEALGPLEGVTPYEIVKNMSLQVIRTRIFLHALKIVEFFDPAATKGQKYTHDLSQAAHDAVKAVDFEALPEDSRYNQIAPLILGPVCLVTFPAVSPDHLAAALSILKPTPGVFPAPTRKKVPSYYDPPVQTGLQKLLLIGGRVEDRIFDIDGIKWVAGMQGGVHSQRARLVHMLQSAGMGLTSALEGAGKSLWLTMESRRSVLEEEAKGPEEKTEEKEESS